MEARYLRLSVTGRCNLRCTYCRPEGSCGAESEPEFTPEEISTLVRCAAAEGVEKVRLTGGEPLLREDLEDIVGLVSSVAGIRQTTLTTNAVGLAGRAAGLRQAGLDRVNISLDTLHPERFAAIAGADMHADVLEGIEAASETFDEVKLNAVLLRGMNDDEIETLVAFAAGHGMCIRFIERYASVCTTQGDGRVPADEVKERLRMAFGALEPVPGSDLSVAQMFALPSMRGAAVGVIASVSERPCERCSKLRFTASGELRPCLFSDWGIDIGPALRADDARAVRSAVRLVAREKGRRVAAMPVAPEPISKIGG